MRKSMDRSGRGTVCALASLALPAAPTSTTAAPKARGDRRALPVRLRALSVRLKGLRIPAHSAGRMSVVAYDGDRGSGKDKLFVRNTLGIDSDVFDMQPALRYGVDRRTFRCTTRRPGYLLGALFVQADARR